VSLNGRPLSVLESTADSDEGYSYDAGRRMLRVRVREAGERQTIAVR
jgi:hypothetical protein